MTEIADRIRRLLFPRGENPSDYNRGYLEAVDMAIRLAENRHTIIECGNSNCTSPVRGLHCFECDEIEEDYGADHIHSHQNA